MGRAQRLRFSNPLLGTNHQGLVQEQVLSQVWARAAAAGGPGNSWERGWGARAPSPTATWCPCEGGGCRNGPQLHISPT